MKRSTEMARSPRSYPPTAEGLNRPPDRAWRARRVSPRALRARLSTSPTTNRMADMGLCRGYTPKASQSGIPEGLIGEKIAIAIWTGGAPMNQPALSATEVTEIRIREGLTALWHGRLIIVGVTLLALSGAYFYSSRQTPSYESQTKVLVETISLGDGTQVVPNMDTETQIAESPAVGRIANDSLDLGGPVQGLLSHISVDAPLNTQILVFDASAPSPRQAQRIAKAFGDAYLSFTEQRLAASLSAPVQVLQDRLSSESDRRPSGTGQHAQPFAQSFRGRSGRARRVPLGSFQPELSVESGGGRDPRLGDRCGSGLPSGTAQRAGSRTRGPGTVRGSSRSAGSDP